MKTLIFLISLLIFSANSLQCGVENIENCLECDIGSKINSCRKCEDNYFLFLDNVLCLPCDDQKYGQIGCNGKCSSIIDYDSKQRDIYCLDDCKEEYFKVNNICKPCSTGISNCRICEYDPPTGINNLANLKCTACSSNQYILQNDDKTCQRCPILNCNLCYKGVNIICYSCNSGYYRDEDYNLCNACYWNIGQVDKVYPVCSDYISSYNPSNFYCSTKYTRTESNECKQCPTNCFSCGYDFSNINSKCFSCIEGFTLNSQGNCVSCEENCNYCYLDENNNPNCLLCSNGDPPNENKNCLSCGSNCKSCIKRTDTNSIECTKCDNNYGLNQYKQCVICPTICLNCFLKEGESEFSCSSCSDTYHLLNEDDKCISCADIEEIGGSGCSQCYYDNSSPDDYKYKCKVCNNGYVLIENEYKCISNSVDNLNGCANAIYNNDREIYECLKCNSGYIYVLNKKNV